MSVAATANVFSLEGGVDCSQPHCTGPGTFQEFGWREPSQVKGPGMQSSSWEMGDYLEISGTTHSFHIKRDRLKAGRQEDWVSLSLGK